MERETNKKNLKERIEDCLFVMDFDTQRMSSGGREAYGELRKIVIDLYNDNLKMKEKIKICELEKSENEEEESI